MSYIFSPHPELTERLRQIILDAIDLGARSSKRIIARIRESGITEKEATDNQLQPFVQNILKSKGLFKAKKKVEAPPTTNSKLRTGQGPETGAYVEAPANTDSAPDKTTNMRVHILYKIRRFFRSIVTMITPTGRISQNLGRVFALIFCVLFLFIFYQFSQNGRYQVGYNRVIIDTRTGAVYKREVGSSSELEMLNQPVSDEE